MKKPKFVPNEYKVEVFVTLRKRIIVKAKTAYDAREAAKEMWENDEIKLDMEADFETVEMEAWLK